MRTIGLHPAFTIRDSNHTSTRHQCVLIKPAKGAAMEDQWLTRRTLEVHDLTNHELVIARRHNVENLTAHDRQRVTNRIEAVRIEYGMLRRKLTVALCKRERNLLLIAVQHIDAIFLLACTPSSVRVPCASETSTSSGSSETLVNELSVIPCGAPLW